jgi:spore coat polysaccharide biosynthesis protein SpsF
VQLGINYGVTNEVGLLSEEDAVAIVQAAVNAGIKVFDTARKYGLSERRVGLALDWERATAVTKVDDWSDDNAKDGAWCPKAIEAFTDASVYQSCRELRRFHLPIVLAGHTLTNWRHEGIWPRLLDLQKEGVIGKLGVSTYGPEDVLEVLKDSSVQHIQLPFNLLDWRWRKPEIAEAIRARPDVTIHARSIYLQGLLLTSDLDRWPAIPGYDASSIISSLDTFVTQFSLPDRLHLVVSYCLAERHNWISQYLVGVTNMSELEGNIEVFQTCSAKPLTEEQCCAMDDTFKDLPVELLNPGLWPKKK